MTAVIPRRSARSRSASHAPGRCGTSRLALASTACSAPSRSRHRRGWGRTATCSSMATGADASHRDDRPDPGIRPAETSKRERSAVTFVFSIDAVLHCRFGISPLGEVVQTARAIGVPARGTSHFEWLKQRRTVLQKLHRDHDLSLLLALLPEHGYMPDFPHRRLRRPVADIDEELTRIRQIRRSRLGRRSSGRSRGGGSTAARFARSARPMRRTGLPTRSPRSGRCCSSLLGHRCERCSSATSPTVLDAWPREASPTCSRISRRL